MILDRLERADRYVRLHRQFAAALEFLRKPELAEISSGRHAIDGEQLFVIIEQVDGRGRDGARVEYHRRYIDIQYLIGGTEQIGWISTDDCHTSEQPYDPQSDFGLYADAPSTWLTLEPGMLAIFFPEDGHAPLAGSGSAHKAIVKVAVDDL
ncbi:YhcH/YjgK/YiaL family protein [Candidatus Laterigemmans baculatus]|uniref:YhcH/YjgK/YiaL family protein n=1 Tax=Candidatus Laterigemmans baculatus TaxID=2770505 RepID=UPI0013DB412C|nr:YhcH/YjgK/YiaL family protein [Candidatus Laterigemmans baculatus]